MNLFWELLDQPLVHRLGWVLLHSLWQGGVLAALFGIALRALRRRSANARYLVGCLALLMLAVTPLVTFFFVPIPSSSAVIGGTRQTQPLDPGHLLLANRPFVDSLGFGHGIIQMTLETVRTIIPWLVALWLLGVLIFTLRLLPACWRLSRLRTEQNTPLDLAWVEILDDLRCRLNLSRPVRLLKSGLVSVPTVIGWLRPIILLPASSLTGLTPSQLEAILAHELAHVTRCDYLVNAFQIAVETLMFYHPAAWWISNCIREEREQCCDDLAVRICNDRIAYAQALATLEELRADWSRLAFAASGGPLLRRIRRLIGASSEDRPVTVREIGGLTFLVIGLGLIILGISLLLGSPVYHGVARIKIEPDNSANLPSYGGKTDPSIGYPYFMQTEFAVIQSDLVLRQVATELNLSQEWGRKYGRGEPLRPPETEALLRGRLALQSVRNTSLVEIRAFSDQAAEAAKIANSVAQSYKEFRLEQRRRIAEAGIKALENRWTAQEQSVRDAQAKLDRLRQELNIPEAIAYASIPMSVSQIAPPALGGAATLRKLEGMRFETQADLARQEIMLNRLKQLSSQELTEVLPTAAPDPVLNSFLERSDEAEQALLVAQKDYGPEHTEVIKANQRVEDLRQKITMRSRGIMVALDARVAASRQYVENLDIAIQSAMTNDLVLAERSRPYFEKQRELDELIRFRQILNMKIAAEKIDSGLPQRSMVEIIDQATIPLRPASPNRLSGMSFSVLGLFLIALGLVMVKRATRLVPLQHPA